jgi:hypothetical protein
MSERSNERWLDDELRRLINTTRPEFDERAWKERYATEYETLVARQQSVGRSATWTHHMRSRVNSPMARLAVAAGIVVVVALFLLRGEPPEPKPPTPTAEWKPAPAERVTMITLSMTFRRGGMDALDQQFNRALDELGPRPNGALMADLLSDLEG